MKPALKNTFQLIAIASFIFSCNDDSITKGGKSLAGQWNCYEYGTPQAGISPGITTLLTVAYESGLSFSADGTFVTRYHNNGVWWQGDEPVGVYKLTSKTIKLTFAPGTDDELELTLQLIKLDQKHLWFSHSYFAETEYHLERTD